MPDMHYVDSSSIEAIGYDPNIQELHVRFLQSGETYVYYNVEQWVFEEFMRVDSKGQYFNSNIKIRYDFGKL
jgi:hypothetical protein